jgi:hypothetical protein
MTNVLTFKKKGMKEELNVFLRANNCAAAFYANLYKHEQNVLNRILPTLKNKTTVPSILENSFGWRLTPQGSAYWTYIYNEACKLLVKES